MAGALMNLNAEHGKSRFLGDDERYRYFLEQFCYDGSFEEFCAGMSVRSHEMAVKALYTLKGTAANLSLERLADATARAIERLANTDEEEVFQTVQEDVGDAYVAACAAVDDYLHGEGA